MKHQWFAKTLGVAALLLSTAAWSQGNRAYAVGFTPPADNAAPREGVGGSTRGIFFTPADDNAAPNSETTGGATRGEFFTPADDNAAPSESTGGATRGEFFTPADDNAAPSESAGGATRSEVFIPPAENNVPQGTSEGASRGTFFPTPDARDEASSASSDEVRSNVYGITNSVTVASMLAVTPDSFYGTTLEARPTIMIYVPASNADEAIFSLKDEAKDLLYQMTLAVPSNGGVVAVTLPAAAPELTVAQNYQWYLAIKLDGELSPASPFVNGWIKRIQPSSELALELDQGEGLADVAALGANGIWYDTAAQLARLNDSQGSDEMAAHWNELLTSVGLADIAAAPVFLL